MGVGNVKKVLVVDDSAFMRKLITEMLSTHPLLEVIGTARNGNDAISKVIELRPDVVTMDVEMPHMNGLDALKRIMEEQPTPVVMLSSTTDIGAENTLTAMEYGAVDFVAKPGGAISLNLQEVEQEIVRKVVAATNVNISTLVKQPKLLPKLQTKKEQFTNESNVPSLVDHADRMEVSIKKKISKAQPTFVIIGTSTGGPRALQEVLTRLPSTINAPILVVQHMPPGFTKSLAQRLDGLSEIRVKEAENGELIQKGVAYIAPGGKHLKFEKCPLGFCLRLDDSEPPRTGHRPSVDVLLESAAEKPELQFVTAIMTGMGHDGREGMRILKSSCSTVTIAESEQTSVVYGMPKAVKEAGLVDKVVDVQCIATTIMEILHS
ncbi:chemotaxis response regulator protein-glutamate methylesterase [Sporosarcina sp. ACRSL]|uniref:protein-glutamate methylesterase/protein-glutamine glutaminase n=1 Tax=Sporosarcina sp. ACRSL TaxID=2918215 RepID=UPI001EF6A2BD|nr:chemotaxis response regulator protein-glutamate methylesterase [Sporosarcina sp. ACRSL]MCG7342888.1 chemotaxis response regulator protein-glutamate methylesterase [Sporosarcina sp. ACRSL]